VGHIDLPWDELARRAEASEVRCADATAEAAIIAAIDDAKAKGDTLGGVFEVVALGCPVGLGSYVQWDRRLDGRLAQAFCSIQAIKGCEFGMGFETARTPGSGVHDEILFEAGQGFNRSTNNAGGLEGGVTNGQPLVVRAAMKPLSTLRTPLKSVDLATKETVEAVVERSDVCAVLVTDAGILKLHGQVVVASLEAAGLSVTVLEVPDGEAAKTLAVAEHCWDRLLAAGADRTSTVLALGGGAVGDLAGFVAATYMRGANFVPLPTTVLAQVDASSGGKTAIDHPKAKNLIGAFHQPRLVIVDPAVVLTLPDRDFRSGLAEIVKHGVVLDAAYFDDVERSAAALTARDLPTLTRIIGGSCRLKAAVLHRDPEEKAECRSCSRRRSAPSGSSTTSRPPTCGRRSRPSSGAGDDGRADADRCRGLAQRVGARRRHPPLRGAAGEGSGIARLRVARGSLPQGRARRRCGGGLPRRSHPPSALRHGP